MQFKTLIASAATAAIVAGGAFAQDNLTTSADGEATMSTDAQTMDGMEMAPAFTSIEEMSVGDVVGMMVEDPAGDNIGEIDYVVDQGAGAEGVIGIGGFLGLGEYTVAIALEEFELSEDGSTFILNSTKEELEQRPEFDETGVEGLDDDVMISSLMSTDMGTDMDTEMSTDSDMSTDGEMSTDTELDSDMDLETDTEVLDGELDADVDADVETETTTQ